MKSIHSIRDLEQFGLDALTGEACHLTHRMLVDVTARGREIFCAAFGIPDPGQVKLADPWNSGGPGPYAHIGSLMIAHEAWQTLAIWALGLDGADKIVVFKSGQAMGLYLPEDEDDINKGLVKLYEQDLLVRVFNGWKCLPEGDRNLHVMSGRVT